MLYWDKKVSRYRDRRGRFIDQLTIRKAVDDIARQVQREGQTLSQRLIRGDIGLGEWQLGMRDLLKSSHVLAGGIGFGGRKSLTASELGKIGNRTKAQYALLNRFALAAEKGQISELMMVHRAGLYGKAIRQTFFESEKQARREAGFDLCKRILRARESCTDCVYWAGKGYILLDEQPVIGSLKCKVGCLCYLVYRRG